MRLIDADALMPNAEYKGKNDFVSAQDIANTPTIAAPRWHRVEDELPKDNTWCVFISENKHTFEQYRWIGTYSEEWGFQDDDNFMVDNVKYWMPLPEPPKEETK